MKRKAAGNNAVRKLTRPGTKRAVRQRTSAPRPVTAGDIAPVLSEEAIERHHVSQAVEAGQESKLTAFRDVVAQAKPEEARQLAQSLSAILKGASPEDANILR
ncbi:MAG: hypothetical protein RLZZ303_3411 [Candidatus Hydrogenedentota bacterium]|jgi:uncharacterized membrane protein (UPF0182 family)